MAGRRYWIADLHLGHEKVAGKRAFDSTDEHDEVILAQLSEPGADDLVWVLGDISSGRPEDEARALELLRAIPAQLHLIAGNHDGVSSVHRRGFQRQRAWLSVFESVQQFGRVRIGGRDVLQSHYPYGRSGDGPDRDDSRYLEYRLPDYGLPLIHGHTHQVTRHMATYSADGGHHVGEDRQQFCVSWDAGRGLVAEATLAEWAMSL